LDRGRISVARTVSAPYRSRSEVTSSEPICPPAPVMRILFKCCSQAFSFGIR
jgi:hypothetical protein